MKKYVKIAAVLTSICLVCALLVAGVNLFTAPKIEEYQKQLTMEAYMEFFPTMDANNSLIVEDGFKSSYVKEKMTVKDANGIEIGVGIKVSGRNSYGVITLIVGLDMDGKLIGISCTENGQTKSAAELTAWAEDDFTAGMTADDVTDLPIVSGATFGSNLIKTLVEAAFSEAGILTEVQKDIVNIFGESVDFEKSIIDTNLIYANQIAAGYTVKDSNDTLLGYYYDVRVNNTYGYVEVGVGLNSDYSVKVANLVDISQTGGRDETITNYLPSFTNGMTAADVEGVDAVSGATVGSDSAKYAILVAINEAKSNFDETLALNIMFGDYTNTTELKASVEDVNKYFDVLKDGNSLGKVVEVSGSNKYGAIKLYVGLTGTDSSSAKLAGIFVLENGQTAGKDESLGEFIYNVTPGMNGSEMLGVEAISGATFAANTTKDLIASAFEQVTGERPKAGYDEEYLSLFTGVDLTKSKEYDISALDEQFDEAKELYDQEGNLLGYGFVLTSTPNKFDGTLTLMVGVSPTAKLQKVIMLANNQTGGYGSLLDGYENNFSVGMTASDVDSVANATPDSPGSIQFKSLVKLALEAVVSYDEYYLTIFGEDITYEVLENITVSEVLQAVEVKKGNSVLGKAYIVRVENAYGYNVMCVGVNNDGTFKQVLDVENNHSNVDDFTSENPNVFKPGMTLEDINKINYNPTNDPEAHSSFTIENIRLGILIALDVNKNNSLSESVLDETYIKTLFPYVVMTRSSKLTGDFKNSAIYKSYEVVGTSGKDGVKLGYVYFLNVENDDIYMSLVIGVDMDGNYVGGIIHDYQTKESSVINVNGSFSDTLRSRVNTYLNSLAGSNENEIKNALLLEGASYASQLVKYGLRLALNEKANKTLGTIDFYNNSQIYLNAIDNLDLTNVEVLKDFKYENTLAGIKNLADDSRAYIIDVKNVYTHNYILVHVSKNNRLINIYDVENNHAALDNVKPLFKENMTYSQVDEIKYNSLDGDSSYSVELTKLAVKIALKEAKGEISTDILYENYVKELFPFVVMTRSRSLSIEDESFTYGLRVVGVKNFKAGILLGYVLVRNNVMMAFDENFNYVGYKAVAILSEDEQAFYDSITVGLNLEGLNALSGNETAKNNAIKLFEEVKNHGDLGSYDEFVLKSFNAFDSKTSTLLTVKNEDSILEAYSVCDKNKNLLGYSYVVSLSNAYGYNIMLVSLDTNNKLVAVLDIENNHSNIDDFTKENPDVFKSGLTVDDINKINYNPTNDPEAHSSFTVEVIRLGILLAMKEAGVNNDSLYENSAKLIYSYMVATRSEVLTIDGIAYAYKVMGTANNVNNSLLGYYFAVSGDNTYGNITIGVGIDTNGKIVGANYINLDQTGGRAQRLEDYLDKFTDKTEAEVAGVDVVSKATVGSDLIKSLFAKAFEAYNSVKGGNN